MSERCLSVRERARQTDRQTRPQGSVDRRGNRLPVPDDKLLHSERSNPY